ncbi:MAG TPA: DUF4124 domain-containing protein [Gammaproteobacteria bacterium]|nr:DUF4124 domain-containing protein [Gammaproteobacteria bacterium]
MRRIFSRRLLPTLPAVGLVLIVTVSVLPGSAVARVYKWVDDQGTVHYSDSIPPSESHQRREREVKSDNGQTVDVIHPPPTEQELDAQRRRKAHREEVRRREQAKRREDQNLLKTFQSVDEMESARDDRLQAIDSRIELIRERIGKLQARLHNREQEAARIERTGNGDPKPVYGEIRDLRDRIDQNRASIRKQTAEEQRIREKFAKDIARFRDLTAEGGSGMGGDR